MVACLGESENERVGARGRSSQSGVLLLVPGASSPHRCCSRAAAWPRRAACLLAPTSAPWDHVRRRGSPSLARPAASSGSKSMAPKQQRASPSGSSSGVWLRAGTCLLAWAAFCRGQASACPAPCACSGTTVDCHGLGLRSVPKNIPRSAERL